MKRRRGHFCRICGGRKPNEAFSGSGHREHVCKACARFSKQMRETIDLGEEIFNYLRQSHISNKNLCRLKLLATSADEGIAELAGIVLETAAVRPYKKRRLRYFARERQDLLRKLEETGLILAHHW